MTYLKSAGLACLAALTVATCANARDKIKMATIAPGSTAYSVMATMASTVNINQDTYEITLSATGVGTKHMVDVARGKLDMGMATPATLDLMASGQSMFKNLPQAPELRKNLGLVFWFPFGTFHIATRADSGIETLADIKGKKVFLGQPGGGEYHVVSQWITSVTGYTAGIDYTPIRATWAGGALAFDTQEIDVYVAGGHAPFAQMTHLATQTKIRLLGLTQAQADTIAADDPAAAAFLADHARSLEQISSTAYGDAIANSTDVYALATHASVVARLDLDADAVYQITKTFWENLPDAVQRDASLAAITTDTALGLYSLKLHPGALRYYTEVGITVPPALQ